MFFTGERKFLYIFNIFRESGSLALLTAFTMLLDSNRYMNQDTHMGLNVVVSCINHISFDMGIPLQMWVFCV